MNPVEIIARKRDGAKLSAAELEFFIGGFVRGTIPDYQMSAFMMAYYFQDMVRNNLYYDELADLIRLMTASGATTDFSADFPLLCDKHSTGGVGDKLSFLCAPIAVAAGCPSLLLSGRGLGHTGGTLDKMEAVPGVRVDLSVDEIREALKRSGLVITGTTDNIAPADRKMYALRDVTATVPSVGLISASILSKKLAVGPTCLVLDVKFGSGAFMKSIPDARRLAETMIRALGELGRPAAALLTNMDQPLGRMVGNALEIEECVRALRGEHAGLEDIVEISLALAARSIALFRGEPNEAAMARARRALDDGSAFEAFKNFFAAQGADVSYLDHPERLPRAGRTLAVEADRSGFVQALTGDEIGIASNLLGAGRFKKEDTIDPAAGIELIRKIGDETRTGEILARLRFNDSRVSDQEARQVAERVRAAYRIGPERPEKTPLIAGVIE